MARSNSSGVLKVVGAVAAAIVGGVAIGYLVGDVRTPHPAEQVVQQPVPPLSAPTVPTAPPPALRPHSSGNYTAPGAPRIVIREESAPTLRRVDRTAPVAPADTEASQEAPPPVKARREPEPSDSETAPTDTGAGSDATPPASATPDNTPSPADNAKPPAPPPAPTDPDFEHVVKPGDSESGQQGTDKADKAQFRVQTGAYTDESNARSIADQLRGQGYTASTRSEREGDHLVYKVQTGAYRSKSGAAKAAGDLQKKGFPAYVAPITP